MNYFDSCKAFVEEGGNDILSKLVPETGILARDYELAMIKENVIEWNSNQRRTNCEGR